MTLTISLLTPDCIYQASDRRFTTFARGKRTGLYDYENKAVVWRLRLAFTFTGLGELGPVGSERTDRWLAETLSDAEVEPNPETTPRDQAWLIERLCEEATLKFRSRPLSGLPAKARRCAFVGVGWAKFSGEPSFTPYRTLVSNFHEARDSDMKLVELPNARGEFRAFTRKLGSDEGGSVEAYPDAMSSERALALRDELRDATGKGADDRVITQIMGETIRERSRYNNLIGRGLLITVIPRAAVEVASGGNAGIFISGPANPSSATFLYVPAQSWETIAYGPIYVGRGVVISDFKAGPLRDPEES